MTIMHVSPSELIRGDKILYSGGAHFEFLEITRATPKKFVLCGTIWIPHRHIFRRWYVHVRKDGTLEIDRKD